MTRGRALQHPITLLHLLREAEVELVLPAEVEAGAEQHIVALRRRVTVAFGFLLGVLIQIAPCRLN
jgi:hypothetical protein